MCGPPKCANLFLLWSIDYTRVFLTSIPPPPTKVWSDMWWSDPLSNKYVFESKYIHTYNIKIVYWILLKPHSIPCMLYIKQVSQEIPAKNLCGCIWYQGIWKRGINTYSWIICCEGLTDGITFVVKRKKSNITWIIMDAFQFSTMRTIMDAFLVIRSKVAIDCAQ